MIARRIVVRSQGIATEQGTAWFIDSTTLCTAFHVVGELSAARWAHELDDERSYWLDDEHGAVELEPVAFDAHADIALLDAPAEACAQAATLGEVALPQATWEAASFPGFNHGKTLTLHGSIAAVAEEESDRTLQLTIQQGTAVDWRGVSGSAVVAVDPDRVVGLITNVTDGASTCWAAPASALRRLLVVREHRDRLVAALCRRNGASPGASAFDESRLRDELDRALSEAPEDEDVRALAEDARRSLEGDAASSLGRSCPYPGLRPFSAVEGARFFGRAAEVADLASRVRRGEHEIYVIGPSGSGKSSLVTAGLLPRIERSAAEMGSAFIVRSFRPGESPVQRLGEALGVAAGAAVDPQAVRAFLDREGGDRRLLLFVDQLEEVFALAGAAERSPFLLALRSLRSEPRCTLLFSLRADFYGALIDSELWPDLAERISSLTLAPLRNEALREAIQAPARNAGVVVDADLVQALIGDAAGEPGALPLLQETLIFLWERRDGRHLTLAQYETLGEGKRSGLAVAVASHADATFRALSPGQQVIARRVFLRLVSFGEGRPDTRRQQPLASLRTTADVTADFDRTLAVLTDRRLLTLTGDLNGAQSVDLSHESLIICWRQLETWIVERREGEQQRRALEAKADEWVERDRAAARLLDAVELAEAHAWLATDAATELGQSEALRDLVSASARARRRRRTVSALLVSAAIAGAAIALSIVQTNQSKASLANQRAASAETSRARLKAAADARSALVNLVLPPGGDLVSVYRLAPVDTTVRTRSPDEIADGGIGYPDGGSEAGARRFGDEFLLPDGLFRVEYRIGVNRFVFAFHSEGLGFEQTITLPVPRHLVGFTFVPGGVCNLASHAPVAPFLLAAADSAARFSATDAATFAFEADARLPTSAELVCAHRLAIDTLDATSWRWAEPPSDSDVPHGGGGSGTRPKPLLRLVRGAISTTAAGPGLAFVRLARSLTANGVRSGHLLLSDEIPWAIVHKVWLRTPPPATVLLTGPRDRALQFARYIQGEGIPESSFFFEDGPILAASVEPPSAGALSYAVASIPRPATKIVESSTITIMQPVTFSLDSSEPRPESRPILDTLATSIKAYPTLVEVILRGTAFEGPLEERTNLSRRRAERARDELVQRGVASTLFVIRAAGDSYSADCPSALAKLVRAHTPSQELRRSPSWSSWAEDALLFGRLDRLCAQASEPADNVRLFIARTTDGPTGIEDP